MTVKKFTREEIEKLGFECRNHVVEDSDILQFMADWEGLDSIENFDEWDDWTDWGSASLNTEIQSIFDYYNFRMAQLRNMGFFDEIE